MATSCPAVTAPTLRDEGAILLIQLEKQRELIAIRVEQELEAKRNWEKACSIVQHSRQQLADLTISLKKNEAEVNRFEETGVYSLPVEVLVEIARFAVCEPIDTETRPEWSSRRDSGRAPFMATCRLFHEVMEHTASCWTTIDSTYSMEEVELCLLRSKLAPLHISIRIRHKLDSRSLHFVNRVGVHIERWSSFSLVGNEEQEEVFTALFKLLAPLSAPALRKVTMLKVYWLDRSESSMGMPEWEPQSIFQGATKLAEITLDGVDLLSCVLPLGSAATHFEFRPVATWVDPKTLSVLFSSMSNLTHLLLHTFAHPKRATAGPPVTLPHLVHLHIQAEPEQSRGGARRTDSLRCLAAVVIAPKLHKLTLQSLNKTHLESLCAGYAEFFHTHPFPVLHTVHLHLCDTFVTPAFIIGSPSMRELIFNAGVDRPQGLRLLGIPIITCATLVSAIQAFTPSAGTTSSMALWPNLRRLQIERQQCGQQTCCERRRSDNDVGKAMRIMVMRRREAGYPIQDLAIRADTCHGHGHDWLIRNVPTYGGIVP